MATPMTAAQFASALRAEGLTLVERTGWSTNNRDQVGAWGPLNGVIVHHTASDEGPGIDDVCYGGRPDLPGPLCHGVIHKDGKVTLVGWGRANHAGSGDPDALAAVIAESSTHPKPNENTVDGNARFVGFECVNRGDGQDPWPAVQLAAIVRAAAAVCRHYGWSAESVIGHLEWTDQKIDPRGFTMASLRARIAERLSHPADQDGPLEDDMPQYVNLGLDKPSSLKPGAWDSIEFTQEWTDEAGGHATGGSVFVRGASRFTGSLSLTLHGLPAGAVVQARMSEYEGDGLRADHPVQEITGTDGDTFAIVPLTKRLASGRGMRVRLYSQAPEPVTVSSAVLTVLVWPES